MTIETKYNIGDEVWVKDAYSIGELIEMLPSRYNHEDLEIN